MMPSTITFQAGDLVLVTFPHTGGRIRAVRPALVVLDSGDADVLLARVTSKLHTSPHDVPILSWQTAGLLVPSVVRLHKLATMEKGLVQRRLGSLEAHDRSAVAVVLQQTYGNW